MTPIFVDAVPLLSPVLLVVAVFLMSAFAVFAWLAWKDARQSARQPRVRAVPPRVRPLAH